MNRTISAPPFNLIPELAAKIIWCLLAPCGEPGCTDEQCLCGLCRRSIGVPDSDPRWDQHEVNGYCDGCELCEDEVPLMLFRQDGTGAQFHTACFRRLIGAEA